MSEDYTWDGGTAMDWQRRAQELERELADMRAERAEAIVLMMKFQRERDELRARLEAVPVEALCFWRDPFGSELTAERIDKAWDAITTWLDSQAVQP